MKPIFWILVALLLSPFIITAALFADDLSVVPTINEWGLFLASIKGSVGLGQLGIAGLIVQGVLYASRAKFLILPGKYKLIIVQALSMIAGVITLRMGDFDWASAILHANTLGAVQVFAHQVIKQWTEDPGKYVLPLK